MVNGSEQKWKYIPTASLDNNQQFNCLFGDSEESTQTAVVLTPTVWHKWPSVATANYD